MIFLFPAGISVNVFFQESQTINKNNDVPDFIQYEKKQTGIKFLYPEDSRLSDYDNLIKIELMKKEEIESNPFAISPELTISSQISTLNMLSKIYY